MKNNLVLIAAAIGFSFSTNICSAQKKVTPSGGNGSLLPPVETKAPNSNYKPAFAGQTRVAGVKTQTPYTIKVLTEDLKGP